jgi:hypothetical protein
MLLAKARYIVNPRPQSPEIQIPGNPAAPQSFAAYPAGNARRAGPLPGPALLAFTSSGVSEGIRTPDIQDHNLAL